MKRFVFPMGMMCLSSTGCASTSENLQRETARYIGDISPDQVKVSNIQRGMTDEWIRLRWERETRYYEVYLHQDLWGGWVLTRVWGRRGTELGRIVHTLCASYDDGCERLAAFRPGESKEVIKF